MGRSMTVMKSVPSPGSPCHTPSMVSSLRMLSACLLWSLTFAWSCASRFCCSSLSLATELPEANSASGMKSGATSLSVSASSTNSGTSSLGTAVSSACAFSASSLALASASAAAMAASSAFDLRPRFLGAGLAVSSSAGASTGASAGCSGFSGRSLKRGVGSAVGLLFFRSKFSPSLPLTEYTRSVSFLVIRVRLRLVPIGFLLA